VSRPVEVTIDLDAVTHNLSIVKNLAPHSKIMAVVKADAYGHGVLRIAQALKDVDAFGVARLDEAVVLRKKGYRNKIVLLEGVLDSSELRQAFDLDLDIVIHSDYQIDLLTHQNRKFRVWFKVNTGMNRLGFCLRDARSNLQTIRKYSDEIILMTHFSCAQLSNDISAVRQEEAFDDIVMGASEEKSLANSAAILALPSTHRDWVRPGLMLYGVSPFTGTTASEYGLRPVMTLKSRLIATQGVSAGEYIGYGKNYISKKEMYIGVIAIGYGDGYPRKTNAPVLLKGKRANIVGDCSMDMTTIDLGDISATYGDEVTLWGAGLPVEEVAEKSGMVPYELLCRVKMRAKYLESS
jgi:alanine racemase